MNEPSETSIRSEVRAWLEASWDPELSLRAWREKLLVSGWGCPTWPTQWYGRGLSVALADVVAEELRRVGAVGPPSAGTRMLAAETILEHGSDDLKRRLLPGIITGEDHWCQLFSEPGSGSDLAGLSTRAELVGDEWVINGQKVWATSAHHADYGTLLARTNWDVPKHQGISYFIIELKQPGVVVRPLRQMNGYASFNEIFFNDARVPVRNVVGEVDRGWPVALTTLAHERRGVTGMGSMMSARKEAGRGRVLDEYRAELAEALEPYVWYPQRAGRVDLVVERARATGRNTDSTVRQEIVKLLSMARAAEWTARRAKAARVLGRPPGAEGSLGKLVASHIARAAAHVHTLISGADAMLCAGDGPLDGIIAEILVSVPANSIAGGTDEIQRNILAERVLGMPKEPEMHAGRPFRDVPRNVAP